MQRPEETLVVADLSNLGCPPFLCTIEILVRIDGGSISFAKGLGEGIEPDI
jgi:hypothetical protein